MYTELNFLITQEVINLLTKCLFTPQEELWPMLLVARIFSKAYESYDRSSLILVAELRTVMTQ